MYQMRTLTLARLSTSLRKERFSSKCHTDEVQTNPYYYYSAIFRSHVLLNDNVDLGNGQHWRVGGFLPPRWWEGGRSAQRQSCDLCRKRKKSHPGLNPTVFPFFWSRKSKKTEKKGGRGNSDLLLLPLQQDRKPWRVATSFHPDLWRSLCAYVGGRSIPRATHSPISRMSRQCQLNNRERCSSWDREESWQPET